MSVGQRLGLRLFLEGVEIPVVSATVQCQKNSPAAAAIQIPANDYALDMMPRTLVHLYCYDIYNGSPAEEQVSVGGPGVTVREREQVDPELMGFFPPERFESTDEQNVVDLENSNWRLLFGGEVVGFSFSKDPTSRSIVLQCLDWSSYWDIAYQYMVSGFSLGGGGVRAAFTGASTSVFNDFLEGSGDIVVNLMSTAPRSYPRLQGTLLGALTHIIEAIGGTYFGPRAVRGVNDFFSMAEMRLHLTQMIGANPYPQTDETRLLRAQGFGGLFRRSLSGLGRLVTVRAVLLALQRYIFHEIIPITTPRYIPPLTDPNLPQYETLTLEGDEETRPLGRAAQTVKTRCEEMKERQAASTDSTAAARQSGLRSGLRNELRQLSNLCNTAAARARRVGLQGGSYTTLSDFFGIPEVSRAFTVATTRFSLIQEATNRGQRAEVRTNTFFAPGTPSAETVARLLDLIIADMDAVLNSRHRRRVQRRTSQPDPPPRLLTQIYRPDVWMVAPPRCNVLFPELYSQFTYSRDYNAEVTRLLLRTHSAFFGSDVLFDGFYMAPSRLLGQRRNRPITRGRPQEEDAPLHIVRDLMEHELFTGIIPTFERMSDLNLHALRGGSIQIGDSGVRVGYAQLAANHIFFQYRFKSRQLISSGKFNPYIAFGFPALIIDKYLSVDQLRDGEYNHAIAARLAVAIREGEGDVGPPAAEVSQLREADAARVRETFRELIALRPNTHFLGTPESMTHMVSASSGGTTQMQMGYARTTNERTEFMGDNLGQSSRIRRTRNARLTTPVAAFQAPTVGSRGFRGGRIVEVTDITDQYTRRGQRLRSTDRTSTGQRRYVGGQRLPLFVGANYSGRVGRGTTVLVGVEQSAASYGPEVVALVGTGGQFQTATADGNETLVTFRAYRLVEEVGVYSRVEHEIAPEDLTFPPWYGEHYRSQNIGGLYSYFFGVGAITDPTTFLAPGVNADGGTIGGTAPAVERNINIQFTERYGDVVSGAAQADQAPQAGASSTPEPGGETIGPEGEPADPEVEAALAQVSARSPIGLATEEIVRAYSAVKLGNFDVHQFIRSYTWRPIASMVDLFGTANLEIDDTGTVVRGSEGFHSRAFGDFDDLRQLVGPGEGSRPQTILGLSTAPEEEGGDVSNDARIAARMDTRKEKRIAVLRYLAALMSASGVMG